MHNMKFRTSTYPTTRATRRIARSPMAAFRTSYVNEPKIFSYIFLLSFGNTFSCNVLCRLYYLLKKINT